MRISLGATLQDIANAIYRQEGATQNNNPGNLRYVGQAGATGADSRGFAIFRTLEDGQNAELAQLQLIQTRGTCATGAAVSTLSDLISCLSPASENPTSQYIANVASWTGLAPDTPLSQLGAGLQLPDDSGGFDYFQTGDAGGLDFSDPEVIAVLVGAGVAFWLAFRE